MAERPTATGEHLQLEQELVRRSESQGRLDSPRRENDLTRCPCCARDLVYPINWTPALEDMWSVSLRCPECEWRGGGVYGQEVLENFDEALDEGTQKLLDDFTRLTRANMEDAVERFIGALAAGEILPEDF